MSLSKPLPSEDFDFDLLSDFFVKFLPSNYFFIFSLIILCWLEFLEALLFALLRFYSKSDNYI